MKKVLILIDNLYGGGAQRVVSRLSNALAGSVDVVIMTFSMENSYPLSDRIRQYCFKEPDLLTGYKGILGTVVYVFRHYTALCRQLIDVKEREHPDTVISFLSKPNLLNALTRTRGCRTVMSERNNPKKKGAKYYLQGLFSYLLADRIVFQSRTIMKMFPWIVRRKGVVVPNPVRADCMAVGGSHRIVTMGRLKPQKNHQLLIKAFALFAESHPQYSLYIYGRGYERDEVGYPALIEQLSLSGRVFLEGHKTEVHKEIATAEQFVLSSNFEGEPNALLEAMMMGLPCISTRFEGADELFKDSDACLLTDMGNEKELAEAMTRMADDEECRRGYALRGQAFAKAFSLEKVIPLWHKALFE